VTCFPFPPWEFALIWIAGGVLGRITFNKLLGKQ